MAAEADTTPALRAAEKAVEEAIQHLHAAGISSLDVKAGSRDVANHIAKFSDSLLAMEAAATKIDPNQTIPADLLKAVDANEAPEEYTIRKLEELSLSLASLDASRHSYKEVKESIEAELADLLKATP
ncbi:uncharacterized protein MONBRDRAFT_28074 [Monosiga brevicollis MX1]|uniref:Mediator of RNA polymerase II transcription subunit 10 n=1 Tax=Monosiga brevicollis TaxID=81824 RepID=A9V744_MONBE|nr:uncharacterized protein MONBRDRAFT_28074 [Monosiga brevicollis MX1]EDQ86727.1 predicted protein [Monosiga brevicollis MX1]|eukprot:XP_001748563.1 hypothetical protein [Monosiga brevicollis MX1]